MLFAITLALVLASGGVEAKKREKPASKKFTQQELEPLLKSLEKDGFEREDVRRVFYDQRLRKVARVISFNAVQRETRSAYDKFRNPQTIRKARRFLARHRKILNQVEEKFGVPKQVITAVLLVETQFGRAKLHYRVLEVFTTLAVENSPDTVDRHFDQLKKQNGNLDKDWLATRLMNKANFAYRELVAVLSMFRQNLEGVYNVRGSYSGAIGIPQFLPSSYQRWAVDGNGDGQIDLNQLTDAMYSVANFLHQHGYRRDAKFRTNWKAVWEYNNSTDYVRAIHEIAFRLTWQPKPRRA